MLIKRNIEWFDTGIPKAKRKSVNGHASCVLWLTGLPGSGKSTIAQRLQNYLFGLGYLVYVLDGDNIRHGLNSDLGFSEADRKENIRRIAEVSKLFVDAGFIVITAFISPFREDREKARAIFQKGEFIEVYIKADVTVCERRDPKGHYKKARTGEIKEFTGISSPYEPPLKPELILDTESNDIETCTAQVIEFLDKEKVFYA